MTTARPARLLFWLALGFASGALAQPPVTKTDEAPKADKAKWNVDSPPTSVRQVPIDTDEGTWMSLDVSPDGKEICFDLLGDLYTIPIGGGEAKPLTSGIAWDMQPRYSPDGSRIAFTSDRTGENGKGGDNIWTIKRDGSEPKQITKETFRLVNSPAWSPDGQFIVAHKHFSSRRSLGAGEMWLYHVSGGTDGLQMTAKTSEQKDTGEPVFSADGKYLYYSFDASPGANFEYDKDSNAGIYAINRLDRQSGQIETVISGPGGACRPTPSPDGKTVAFVRRVRFKTCLFLQDVASGQVKQVYDALERDMQETWAIHGVYPTMAWMPDGKSIVLWAAGQIKRVTVADGEVKVIPFHVKTARAVAEAVRFPVEVAPERFEVKMLRSVEVAPKGDAVVYEALGHLYTRGLPEGIPKRLTKQNEDFEFFPSYSRDGKWVVYTTWNDDKLGSVRIAPASGGEGRALTTEPGHYVDPVFSPDGTKVLFGKVSGGYLSSPIWSYDPGLYMVDLAARDKAKPVRISRKGTRPQFGAENDRVYLQTLGYEKENDHRVLLSMKLDGSDERTHVSSDNATEFSLSPDGKWLAFAERFNVYITPFVPTGREFAVGPKSTGAPTAKVTSTAGENLHWSGDSTALHWSLGPELYTRKLTDSFAFLAGAPEKLPEPPAAGVNISFTAPADAPSGALALVGGRIITMKGDEVVEDGIVVVERNRITAVGARDKVQVPSDATVIDCSGKTLMPGMIDVHAHGGQGMNGMTPQKNWGQYSNLAFGVTTIHDPSNDTHAIFAASELQRAGLIVSPRTYSTGTILYGAAGSFKAEIDSLDDALFHLRRMKAVGAISVKSYNQPRRDQRQQVLEAARELGMMVVPEGGSLFMHNMTMVVDGHTGVEHSLPVENVYRDVTQLWGATKVGYTPTLIVGYGGIMGENYWYDRTNVWEDQRLLNFVPRFIVDPRSRRRVKAPDEEYNHLRSSGICKAIVDAGGKVQLGAHGQLAGLGAHWELWMLSQGGLTPLQAIRAATFDGAFYVGLDKDIGSIEAGKLADLLVLDKNPLEDIRNSESIRYTMLNGRLFDARTMEQVGNHPAPAPKFYFAEIQGAAGIQTMIGGCAGCGIPGAGCESGQGMEGHGIDGYR